MIIHRYTLTCANKGISFDCDVQLCSLNCLEDINLVVILGNLMDNTLSAAEKQLHGFGLKSVRQTLRKYQGDFDWSYDPQSRILTVTAMIGQKSTQEKPSSHPFRKLL